jgi:hypothetical protein
VNSELKWTWKEAGVLEIEVVFSSLRGGAEEEHKKLHDIR